MTLNPGHSLQGVVPSSVDRVSLPALVAEVMGLNLMQALLFSSFIFATNSNDLLCTSTSTLHINGISCGCDFWLSKHNAYCIFSPSPSENV